MREWWGTLARGERRRIVLALAFAVVLAAAYEVQQHRVSVPAIRPRDAVSTVGPAADLTAFQVGHRPGPRNTMLVRITSLLEVLEADCPADTRAGLVALTLESVRRLHRAGLDLTPNAVLGGVLGTAEIGSTAGCGPFFRRYVAGRVAAR